MPRVVCVSPDPPPPPPPRIRPSQWPPALGRLASVRPLPSSLTPIPVQAQPPPPPAASAADAADPVARAVSSRPFSNPPLPPRTLPSPWLPPPLPPRPSPCVASREVCLCAARLCLSRVASPPFYPAALAWTAGALSRRDAPCEACRVVLPRGITPSSYPHFVSRRPSL